MNKSQRKDLDNLSTQLDRIRCILEETRDLCEDEKDEGFAALDFSKLYEKLDLVGMHESIGGVYDEIDCMRGDEIDKFDNLSEGLQSSEKGEALQNAADSLESVLGALDGATSSLDQGLNGITAEILSDMCSEAAASLEEAQGLIGDAQG